MLWLIFILLVILFVPTGLLALLAAGPFIFIVNFIEAAQDFDGTTWLYIAAGIFLLALLGKYNEKLKLEEQEKQEKKEFMRQQRNKRKWLKELDEIDRNGR